MSQGFAIIVNGKRQSDGAGYLFNDNRAAGEGLEEADVFACNHCQKLLIGQNWRENGGWCGCCGQPMCASCADEFLKPPDQGGGCRPYIRQIEEMMNRAYHQQQISKILGI
jgi:hypothetical protein